METNPLPEALRQDLMLYALGALDADEAQAMETRLQHADPDVHQTLAELQDLVDRLGYAAPLATPPPSLKDKLFARIQTEPQEDANRPLSIPLANYDTLVWEPSGLPGISLHYLRRDAETKTIVTLMRATPGSRFIPHRHRGAEDTLVLQGHCRDRYGTYQAGDFISYPPNSVHTDLEALGEEDCILFIVSHQGFDLIEAGT